MIVGDLKFVEQAYPAEFHVVSGKSIRETALAMLALSSFRLPGRSALEPESFCALHDRVAEYLSEGHQRRVFSRAQILHLDTQRKVQWDAVKAIIAGNRVIGKGARSVVYEGKMRHYPSPVAIKALDVKLSQAHSTKDFQVGRAAARI